MTEATGLDGGQRQAQRDRAAATNAQNAATQATVTAAQSSADAITTASQNQMKILQKSLDAQTAASDKQLAFQQQQYDTWKSVYGPVQDNLSSFYQSISADSVIASGLQNYENQHVAVQQNLQRQFKQRGIDSPAQALLQQQDALGTAAQKASIRTSAPQMVAQLQQGFVDHNVSNPAAQGIAGAYSNRIGLLGNAGAQQSNVFGQQGANLANVYGNQGSQLSSLYSGQAQMFDSRAQQSLAIGQQNLNQLGTGLGQLAGYALLA